MSSLQNAQTTYLPILLAKCSWLVGAPASAAYSVCLTYFASFRMCLQSQQRFGSRCLLWGVLVCSLTNSFDGTCVLIHILFTFRFFFVYIEVVQLIQVFVGPWGLVPTFIVA